MTLDVTTSSAYLILDAKRDAGGYTSMPTGVDCDAGSSLFAIGPDGMRRLLVPISDSEVVREDTRGASVQVLEHTLEDAGQQKRYIDVVCLRTDLDDVFGLFVDDVLSALGSGRGEVSAVSGVLSQWRELLAGSRALEIGDQRLAGFLGELLTFLDVERMSPSSTLDAWVGPSGNLHDIIVSESHFEVKTTTSMQNRHVVINGLAQLDDVVDATLYLVSVRLVPDPDGDVSLRALIEDASQLGIGSVDVYTKAASAGIDASSLARAAARRFRHIDTLIFKVDDQFPRLTERSIEAPLPQGVSDVRYTVRLDGLAPFATEVGGLWTSDPVSRTGSET